MNSLYLEVPLPLDGFLFSLEELLLWRNSDCYKICPDSSTLCDEDKNYTSNPVKSVALNSSSIIRNVLAEEWSTRGQRFNVFRGHGRIYYRWDHYSRDRARAEVQANKTSRRKTLVIWFWKSLIHILPSTCIPNLILY